jgi:hypothetical protein
MVHINLGGENFMDWRKLGFFASLASIFGSIGIYFNGDEQLGIFVGLWASALLLLSDRLAQMTE